VEETSPPPFPSAADLAERVPRYERWELVSRTNMSSVYSAHDRKVHGRKVAVKVILPQIAYIPDVRERFVRETRTTASLRHHNIIDIIGLTEDDQDLLYLVMPYIDGPDLSALVEREGRPLEPARALHIVRQAAKALDHAHRSGVVHRDVKPANILVYGEDEHVYLCDFGIALVESEPRLTDPGNSPGSPGYAPPERYGVLPAAPGRTQSRRQAEPGEPGGLGESGELARLASGRREDVYGLGAVLGYCLTGQAPSGASWPLPRGPVGQVVRKAMSTAPEDRYDSCAALVADLEQAVRDHPRLRALHTVGAAIHGPLGPVRRAVGAAARAGRARPKRLIAVSAAMLLLAAAVALHSPVDHGPGKGELARIPAAFRTDCTSVDDDAGAGLSDASAVLSCRHAGQGLVFSLFDTSAVLDDAYTAAVKGAGIMHGSGDCTVAIGAEHRYPGAGPERGRVLCYERDGQADFLWTDDSLLTIAQADRKESDDLALASSWTSWVGLPAFPTAAEKSLMDLVQLDYCRRTPAGDFDVYRNVLAAIDCSSPGDGADQVTYYRFGDPVSLRGAHDGDATRVKAPAGKNCADNSAPGFLGDVTMDLRSVVVGDQLCYTDQYKLPVVEWTEEPLLVMGRATGSDQMALAAWWRGYFGYAAPTEQLVTTVNQRATPVFPDAREQALLTRIPASSRVDCMRPSPSQIVDNVGRTPVEAAVVCGPTLGAGIVFYYQLDDAVAMNAVYARNSDISGPDCTTQPADFLGGAPYSKPGVSGRLGCASNDGSRWLVWTDDQLDILAFAFEGNDRLLDWWRSDAGPV